MTVGKKSSAARRPYIYMIAAAAAVLLIVLIVFFPRPDLGGSRDAENKLLQQIKQEERILILYESVIGVKAKDFDGKLKIYQYGINEQQLGAGSFLNSGQTESSLPGGLMSMEKELQAEMDLIGLLIRQREEMKERIARMHFQRKFNAQAPVEEMPSPESSPSAAAEA